MRQVIAGDVRFGGTWTRSQSLKNDAVYVLARAALAVATRLPRWLLRAAAAALAFVAYAIGGSKARANVAAALGPANAARIARASFSTLARNLADLVAVLGGGPLEPLSFAPGALETIAEARREQGSVIFASAHLGPWERVAASLVAAKIPLVAVVREPYDPRLDFVLQGVRDRAGLRCISRGNPNAPIRILRALREGAVLGVPMDLRTRAENVVVPFFGRDAATVVGPARLALRVRSALVVGTLERVDGRLVVTATRLPVEGDEASLTARLNAEIERRIRTAPEQWLWMHPRW